MTSRKKLSTDAKLDATSLITDQDYTRIGAAKSLGIKTQLVTFRLK